MLSGLGVFLVSEPHKSGSSSLKTIIIAEGVNIRQLQYTKQPIPKIFGTRALLIVA
jgi:hypothetical protein